MIIFIEGCRHVGKTHLIDSFFRQNTDPNVIYYKFRFAHYIDELGMRDQETGPGVHYFSISNVLTILELNRTLLKDKIVIFDRSIFSAYVWSIYRNRMDRERLVNEFEKILNGDLYENCALFYLSRKEMPTPEKRNKDYFGNFENYDQEKVIFDEIISKFMPQATDTSRNNKYIEFVNNFDEESIVNFCSILNTIGK